jgi:CheY-like chemotaxis protein
MSTAAASRVVRIHLAMKDGPLPRSIKQVLPIVGNETSHVYVESQGEADLIVFTDVRDVERSYSKKKSYAYLELTNGIKGIQLPSDNCVTVNPLNLLTGLIEVIDNARKKLAPVTELASLQEEEIVPLHADALGVLVIDDMPENITSAKKGLAGHHLTTVTSYEEAMSILGKEKFDVVLTDLHLPMSSRTMGSKFKLGELVPYGILLMVEAAHRGAQRVAVVTDLSHHDDPFSAAFDHFSAFSVKIDNAKVVMMHSPMVDGAKDWAKALAKLMA